jgi:uncharacterized repeat protein (TIGR01451 family)
MQIVKLMKARPPLMIALLFLVTATSACAQEKPKRMIPGPSVKELIPESPNEKDDGIAQITLGQLFKPGSTEYTRVGANALKDAPPLPTGFVLFKDLVYRVRTEAIMSGYQLTVFSFPSVPNEGDFRKLNILHLEDDEMSPSGFSWTPVTVFPGGWDEHFHLVSRDRYDALQPDFKSKRIAAITHEFGVFAVALAPDFEAPSTGPFTGIEVVPSSSPVPVAVGEEVTHTILLRNTGQKAAAEVDVKAELNPDFGYRANSNQGSCKQSNESSGRILCYLGAMLPGSTATITVVGRVSRHLILTKELSEVGNMLEVVFKENPTDLVEADNQVIMQFDFKVLKKQ